MDLLYRYYKYSVRGCYRYSVGGSNSTWILILSLDRFIDHLWERASPRLPPFSFTNISNRVLSSVGTSAGRQQPTQDRDAMTMIWRRWDLAVRSLLLAARPCPSENRERNTGTVPKLRAQPAKNTPSVLVTETSLSFCPFPWRTGEQRPAWVWLTSVLQFQRHAVRTMITLATTCSKPVTCVCKPARASSSDR